MIPAVVFPARFVSPESGVHHPVKAATDRDGLTHIYGWRDGRPVELAVIPVDEWEALPTASGRPRQWATPAGLQLSIEGGCGCGSPLRAWRPPLTLAARGARRAAR